MYSAVGAACGLFMQKGKGPPFYAKIRVKVVVYLAIWAFDHRKTPFFRQKTVVFFDYCKKDHRVLFFQ